MRRVCEAAQPVYRLTANLVRLCIVFERKRNMHFGSPYVLAHTALAPLVRCEATVSQGDRTHTESLCLEIPAGDGTVILSLVVSRKRAADRTTANCDRSHLCVNTHPPGPSNLLLAALDRGHERQKRKKRGAKSSASQPSPPYHALHAAEAHRLTALASGNSGLPVLHHWPPGRVINCAQGVDADSHCTGDPYHSPYPHRMEYLLQEVAPFP